MRKPPPPLDDELEAWLSPARAVPEAPIERADAVLVGVHRAVALSSPAAATDGGSLPAHVLAGSGFALGVLVGGAAMWGMMQMTLPPPLSRLAKTAVVEAAPREPTEPALDSSAHERAEHEEPAAATMPPRAREAPRRRRSFTPTASPMTVHPREEPSEPPSVDVPSGLAAERRIIDAALAQLNGGNPAAALRTVARHRARFTDGQLVQLREVLRIRALVALGRRQEARRVLAAMEAAHPHDAVLPSLRELVSREP